LEVGTERFIRAIRAALVGPPELSQRDLSAKLGITIGSLSKYLRGEVMPCKVGFEVQCNLAKALGHTVDALRRYYQTGEWKAETSLEDVMSWIRSDAGAEDLPSILESMQAMAARTAGVDSSSKPDKADDYLWPLTALKQAEVKDKMREKLGLTDERLWALAKDGTFDDDLVDAFSLACDYDEDAVREAFSSRTAIV
jgi:transcriptional regulator with XRE-family HTH domain